MTETAAGHPPESFDEFLGESRLGLLYASEEGRILYANPWLCKWLQMVPGTLLGTRFSDHLPIVRKVYYETHLRPLLRMQGFFDEVALEFVRQDGSAVPVFVSGAERHDQNGQPKFVCFTLFPAVERRKYERHLVSAKNLVASDNSRLREEVAEHARARVSVEERLSTAEHAATLREQFIAVLGHDLRNPLAAVGGAMRLIAKTPLNERAATIVGMVHQSLARMADLIDNVMDFARGRLGGGLTVTCRTTDLGPPLEHVVRELEVAWPDRRIERDLQLSSPVYCDANRISQLLSNLLANAIVHGSPDGPIRVLAHLDEDDLVLAVTNTGDPISQAAMERLFEPFEREDVRPSQQGLGLGLYIASEIARAHAGELSVLSSQDETRFTLRMPAAAPNRDN
jgi:sigma-B regulation protein RsbU (phosphoserine phosphatase)